MRISLRDIQAIFCDYPTQLIGVDPGLCLCGFCRLDEAMTPYHPSTLYVTDHMETLTAVSPIPGMSILFCGNCTDGMSPARPESDVPHDLLQKDVPYTLLRVSGLSLPEAEYLLTTFFNQYCGRGLFSDTLLHLLFSENGIQSMVDLSFTALGNPIMVFDAGYHLIAANWNEVTVSPFGQSIVEHGGFSEKEFELVNHLDHIHKKLIHSPVPLKVHHPEHGFDQMICTINPEKDVGHIVLSALIKPFSDYDADFLMMLQKAIDQQMKKDEFVRNNKGFHYEYFIRDLLDKKIAASPQLFENFQYIKKEFSGLMFCIVVETARSSSTLNALHIRSEFEQHFPGTKTLLYNGEIIAILRKENRQTLTKKELLVLRNICRDHSIFAGLSNGFENITELHGFYRQSLRAIELGSEGCNTPDLFIYRDHCTRHLGTIFSQTESTETFCHPELRKLYAYDEEHDTHLAETLYQYLVNERNYTLAAEAMYVHRNTMIYRIKKIKDLTGIDFEDRKERQYLILSYVLRQ